MKNEIEKTISYFRIFDYFLNKEDLYDFLHTNKPVSKEIVEKKLKTHFKILKGYIFLQVSNTKKIREKIILQIKKEKLSVFKFKLAKNVAGILRLMPSVKMIAISGALAMRNAGDDDDIDLFIVTTKKTIWTTRFFCSLILMLLRKRRLYGEKNVKNKFCLNFFIDENHLEMKKKNLYTAHEIAQMKVLYEKDNIYQKLIKENQWGREYLAHFFLKSRKSKLNAKSSLAGRLVVKFLQSVEPFFRAMQFAYMKPKITSEIIENGILMFHPRDYSKEILKKYETLIS